jgi:hypothetical protein
MVIIRFVSLKCITMSDPFGQDEVFIKVDGREVQEKIGMRVNDEVNFGPRMKFEFAEETVVEFWERELAGHHDLIGRVAVAQGLLGQGIQKNILQKDSGHYEFCYEVVPE